MAWLTIKLSIILSIANDLFYIIYHLCCSYVVPHVVCIYAILRILDIYVETLFFSRVPTVNIAQKNFGNILWKHFKIFSFAGVR